MGISLQSKGGNPSKKIPILFYRYVIVDVRNIHFPFKDMFSPFYCVYNGCDRQLLHPLVLLKKNFFTPIFCYNKYAFRKSKSIVYEDIRLEKKVCFSSYSICDYVDTTAYNTRNSNGHTVQQNSTSVEFCVIVVFMKHKKKKKTVKGRKKRMGY